jgi:hypothetical protein
MEGEFPNETPKKGYDLSKMDDAFPPKSKE